MALQDFRLTSARPVCLHTLQEYLIKGASFSIPSIADEQRHIAPERN
jgi:hypothetical protein